MFDFCNECSGQRLFDERSECPGNLATPMLNDSRALNTSFAIDTLVIIANCMIQSMTMGEKLECVSSTTDEAQSVPQRGMVLRQVKGFSGKLPKDRTLKIM